MLLSENHHFKSWVTYSEILLSIKEKQRWSFIEVELDRVCIVPKAVRLSKKQQSFPLEKDNTFTEFGESD